MSAPVVQDFRRRLLDGLAASIEERGYRESTVADIVRCARTSKRTFYDHFAGKEECFIELVSAKNDDLVVTLTEAVDPEAPWQAAGAPSRDRLCRHHRGQPGDRAELDPDLPALGDAARPTVRRGFSQLPRCSSHPVEPRLLRAGLQPMSPAAALSSSAARRADRPDRGGRRARRGDDRTGSGGSVGVGGWLVWDELSRVLHRQDQMQRIRR